MNNELRGTRLRYAVHVEAESATLTIEADRAQEARVRLVAALAKLYDEGERGWIEAHVIGYDHDKQVLDLDLRGPIDEICARLVDERAWAEELDEGRHVPATRSTGPSI